VARAVQCACVVKTRNLLSPVPVVVVSSLVALTAACGGNKTTVRSAEKLPADGAPAEEVRTELPVAQLAASDWQKTERANITPACDARVSPPRVDTAALLAAKEVVSTWMDFKKAHPKPARHGIKSNGTQDPTLDVDSVGMTCSPGKNTVEVNGQEYPFDIAWVVSGKGASITDGVEDAGRFAMIQALSLKDKRMVVVKVFYPSDAHRETDDAVAIGNLENLVASPTTEPVVHNVGEKDKPQLETFIADKGAKEGIYTVAPKQTQRTRARYVGVGRFTVGE